MMPFHTFTGEKQFKTCGRGAASAPGSTAYLRRSGDIILVMHYQHRGL